jgi:hypothetical protein
MDFRQGLVDEMHKASGLAPSIRLTRDDALAIAHALANVRQTATQPQQMDEAVRLILFEIWHVLGASRADGELGPILRESWAGSVLARMQAHAAAREAGHRAHAQFEAGAERRKEEKKRLKQERHATRLAAKADRDRLWREKQKGCGK